MVYNTIHMIQVIQINRKKNKGKKRGGGERKKGGNTMNGNRTQIIIF